MSKVIKNGKLMIIDPNQNSEGGGLVPYDLEDLCLGVSLKVKCPHRDNIEECEEINFIFGKKVGVDSQGNEVRYLTTEYTDISNTEATVNSPEGLGIENINISYSSWYHPQVTIKFVDVRGASLFIPEENQTYTSFFSALFHFPSPLFELTIKGFLGGSATYSLKVSDFKGELNTQTGNFEANVEFIGSMYGPYADVPVSFLSLAPLMNGAYDGISY